MNPKFSNLCSAFSELIWRAQVTSGVMSLEIWKLQQQKSIWNIFSFEMTWRIDLSFIMYFNMKHVTYIVCQQKIVLLLK